jgi:hypothetical protein
LLGVVKDWLMKESLASTKTELVAPLVEYLELAANHLKGILEKLQTLLVGLEGLEVLETKVSSSTIEYRRRAPLT